MAPFQQPVLLRNNGFLRRKPPVSPASNLTMKKSHGRGVTGVTIRQGTWPAIPTLRRLTPIWRLRYEGHASVAGWNDRIRRRELRRPGPPGRHRCVDQLDGRVSDGQDGTAE